MMWCTRSVKHGAMKLNWLCNATLSLLSEAWLPCITRAPAMGALVTSNADYTQIQLVVSYDSATNYAPIGAAAGT